MQLLENVCPMWWIVKFWLVIFVTFLNMWMSNHTRTHRNDSRSSAAMCRAGCSIDQCLRRCMNIKGSIPYNIYNIDKDMTQRAMLCDKPIIPATGLHVCATQLHGHH